LEDFLDVSVRRESVISAGFLDLRNLRAAASVEVAFEMMFGGCRWAIRGGRASEGRKGRARG